MKIYGGNGNKKSISYMLKILFSCVNRGVFNGVFFYVLYLWKAVPVAHMKCPLLPAIAPHSPVLCSSPNSSSRSVPCQLPLLQYTVCLIP